MMPRAVRVIATWPQLAPTICPNCGSEHVQIPTVELSSLRLPLSRNKPALLGCLFVFADGDEKTFSYQAPDKLQFFGHVDVTRQRGDGEFARLNDEA